jgi:uncharacterized protein (TIGR02996 family)
MPNPLDHLTLTTDERPFIRAIAEDLDNDSTRLVYADWLEDQGDPYGEFIRVQVQLANLGATDPRRPFLEKRQSQLEQAVSLALWRKQLLSYGFEMRCRRGFVEEMDFNLARCPLSDFTYPTFRFAEAPVQGEGGLASLLSPSCRFAALLTTLCISADDSFRDYGSEREFRLPPHPATDFLALSCFSNLHTLAVGVRGALILGSETVRGIVSHSNLGRLRKLILDTHPVGEEGCRSLVDSARLARLTSLSLARTGINNKAARVLAGSPLLANLTELDLRSNCVDDEGARALADSTHLLDMRRLKLHGNAIGPEGAAALKRRFGQACLLPRLPGPGRSRPGDWHCYECSASNFASRDVCYECHSPKRRPFLREGDWLCVGCNAHNFARRQTCHRCKGLRQS